MQKHETEKQFEKLLRENNLLMYKVCRLYGLKELYAANEKLNQVEKAIVMLYMEDKTYEEMEEILGINQGSLRVKMSRIKEKIRQITKPD